MKSQCEPGSKAIYTADDRTWNHSLISGPSEAPQGWGGHAARSER